MYTACFDPDKFSGKLRHGMVGRKWWATGRPFHDTDISWMKAVPVLQKMTAQNTKRCEDGGSIRRSHLTVSGPLSVSESNSNMPSNDLDACKRQHCVQQDADKLPTNRRSLTEPVDVAACLALRRNVSAPTVSNDTIATRGLPSVEVVQSNPGRVVELLAKYHTKVRDNKRMLSRLRLQKDAQLEIIKNQLFILESQLRKEQKEILSKLDQRDATIASQQHEITKLRKDNRRLMNRLKKLSEGQESSSGGGQYFTSTCSSSELSDASLYGTLLPKSSISASMIDLPSRLSPCVTTALPRENGCTVGSNNLSLRVKEQKYSLTNAKKSINAGNKISWEDQLRASKSVETVNPNVASVRAMTDRVLHKPPIAEKPKVCTAGCVSTSTNRPPQKQIPQPSGVQSSRSSRQCTIVSTISRLLEEESDGAGGGSSSEPSSPEATLKPQTPRVIRLARQYEGIVGTKRLHSASAESASSPEFLRSQERVIKSLLIDEYEVTSGYNSDAISDHDYENVRLASDSGSMTSSNLRPDSRHEDGKDESEDGYAEEDDNYVVLEPTKKDDVVSEASVWEVGENDDLPIYSNLQFGIAEERSYRGRKQMPLPTNGVPRTRSLDNLLETNIDSPVERIGSAPSSPSKSQDDTRLGEVASSGHMKNSTRCRRNIRHLVPEQRHPNHMTDNFEEFTLDSLELDEDQESVRSLNSRKGEIWGGVSVVESKDGKENLLPSYELRRCGDGAEMKNEASYTPSSPGQSPAGQICSSCVAPPNGTIGSNGHSYEKFLEATGLSQKSILTPSRLFSNHRSVLKPRDIKHRDKLRSAFTTLATLEEAPSPTPPHTNPARYWTEPYL
ncbi:hypothetical protein FHG87_007811 [Trinorchestia longiramus]|nr:hypothetical protein FHG87_007811 [Trinorchestia longiramus]